MVKMSYTDGTIILIPEITPEEIQTTDVKSFVIIKGGKIVGDSRWKFNR